MQRIGGLRTALVAAVTLALVALAPPAHATDVDPFPDIATWAEIPGTRVSGDVEITCPDGSGRGIEANVTTKETFAYCVKTWQPQAVIDDQAIVQAAQAAAEVWAAAALTPGVQVCKQWSYTYSNGISTASGGVCVIVPVLVDTVTVTPVQLDTVTVPAPDTATPTPAPIEDDTITVTPPQDETVTPPAPTPETMTPQAQVEALAVEQQPVVLAAPAALRAAVTAVIRATTKRTPTLRLPTQVKAVRVSSRSLTSTICRVTDGRTVRMLRKGKCVLSTRVTNAAGRSYTFRQVLVR